MKKVLIVSYYFSDTSLIGSIRINGLAKFLPKFNWMPVILTAKSTVKPNSQFKVIETPYEDLLFKWKGWLGLQNISNKSQKTLHGNIRPIQKSAMKELLMSCWKEVFAYPDVTKEWYKHAIEYGSRILEEEEFDAIISSFSPATAHIIAKDLKIKYNLPWIADFRDLWTQNHYYNCSSVRRAIERKLEQKTLLKADALVTVSKPLAEKLKQLHYDKEIFVIPNGFDPSQKNPGLPLNEKFTITYTGMIYRGQQDPEPLFIAISNLISNGLIKAKDISIEFYGPIDNWAMQDPRRYNLENIVKIKGQISREESIDKQRRAHMLLLITWNNPNEKGVYTGKVFDYLAAKRPILSIGFSGGVVSELINATNTGVSASNVQEIKNAILDAYNEFKMQGSVNYRGIDSEINKYNHVEMSCRFSKILDSFVNH